MSDPESDPRIAVCVTTWNGHFLPTTLAHIPPGVRTLVVDTRTPRWPLSRGWNYGIDTLLSEGHEVVVVMNDDVVLRPDTLDLLAWGLLVGQYQDPPEHHSTWADGHPELLLLSARHASPSDARTNDVDWELLKAAVPQWQPGPDFACFAVTSKLFQEVGRFDEGFDPCWHEDNDMHRRIQLAGYEAGAFAPDWHLLNGTIRSDPEIQRTVHEKFERSKAYYIAKWGGYLGHERFARPFEA